MFNCSGDNDDLKKFSIYFRVAEDKKHDCDHNLLRWIFGSNINSLEKLNQTLSAKQLITEKYDLFLICC